MNEILVNHAQESKKDLYAALAKAQAEMDMAGENSANPFFKSKYADLAEIVRASRPALTKNGLCVIQEIHQNDQGQNFLHTKLCHASGQCTESIMPISVPSGDMQKFGSAISYARRYSYASIVGVVVCSEDDDGEKAVADLRQARPIEYITKDQHEEIQYHLVDHPDIAESILKKFNIRSLAQLPRAQYRETVNRIQEIKEAKKTKGA